MSTSIRLRPTGLEQQFRDDAGRLWVSNDTRKPGSNPPEAYRCSMCRRLLGPVTFMQQSTDGPVACLFCVEVVA